MLCFRFIIYNYINLNIPEIEIEPKTTNSETEKLKNHLSIRNWDLTDTKF